MHTDKSRRILKSIKKQAGRTPIVISGTFKHEYNPRDYLTFTDIELYVPDKVTKTLLDHVTVKIADVQRHLDIGKMIDDGRYYLMVDIGKYTHERRMGVSLTDVYENPIFHAKDLDEYDWELFDFAYPLDFWCEDNGYLA